MIKNTTIFICRECGSESLKWSGRCTVCGAWNTLKEIKDQKQNIKDRKLVQKPAEILTFDKIETKNSQRIKTGINEVDRVLGGGIVPGAVILLGGDPGIGKSTLLLQIASKLYDVLYVSGEESQHQIKIRANRLKIESKDIHLFTGTNVDEIIYQISNAKQKYKLVIIDSIQTIYDPEYPSTPGSIIQVRECALKLQEIAKSLNISIVLVGHVTKDGNVAGPRTLEHLVDVVLYLEGERYHDVRILRGVKNRFGATDEIGMFSMSENGFEEIINPSKLFLKEKLENASGSVITATMEGTRPFLVEIQALTSPTSFGYPRRTSSGFDLNRLMLLIAVLGKRAGLNLGSQDVYLNVVGGFKLKEPAADLAVCLAIASASKNKAINQHYCIFGEVGLSGEIRSVRYQEKRIIEAKRLGLNRIVKAKTLNEAVSSTIL
jgi:DNA repair protein RadA/Sms